ncbi:metallophosphoesterase family protein [Pseudomonas aeruginosa]|uniref:metallophosphoesterase family protein n=1 Tax=Pseudomonas aeruginosa TaxID=287 RepID=UPI0012DE38B9|nr:metallophosphoesterase [Pseudomonas aeruginosa]
MENTNKLHWMHISDLHRGQDRTAEVWAHVRQEIYDDIKRQIEERGPIDLVVFSGDMAYQGDAEEFASVREEIERLWQEFHRSGQSPHLFLTPGNHDLVRPSKTSALRNMADILRIKTDVRDEILGTGQSDYREEAEEAFCNYLNFIKDIKQCGVPLALDVEGLLPGDSSARFSANGLQIGLVGLNSAWTHLSGGNSLGKLDISVRQLNSVVGADLPKWSRQNHVNLLVTHHPAAWFNPEAREEFEGEIFNPDYFDAHLFGHMHDNKPILSSVGAHNRRTIQASSLFGLEEFEDKEERRHGYYFAVLDANKNLCEYWPRKFEKKSGNTWQVASDSELLRRDSRFFEQPWNVREVDGLNLKKG